MSHKSVNTRRPRRKQKQRKSPFDPFLSLLSYIRGRGPISREGVPNFCSREGGSKLIVQGGG